MTSTLPSPSTHDDSDASAVAERRRPGRQRLPERLPERLAVAIPGVAVLVAAVIIGGALFALVVGIIAVLALYELYSLTAAMRPLRLPGVGVLHTALVRLPDEGVTSELSITAGDIPARRST